MKQQYKGSYTFDVATRTITMLDIEVPPERVLLVVNSTVGFVYHNFAIEPNGDISISGGNTVIVFPPYKDCDTHRNTDALSIFYDDGVDLGKLIRDEFNETQTLLQTEFDETQTALSAFRTEVKAEFDETQTLVQNEFNETQTLLSDFKTEAKSESDETQTILEAGFSQAQTLLSDFKTEVKAESDETQTLLQNEFNETQNALANFRTEVKSESDETQAILTTKLPDLANGRVPVETIGAFDPTNGVTVNLSYSSAGISQVVFSKGGITLKTLNMNYDAEKNLVAVIPV